MEKQELLNLTSRTYIDLTEMVKKLIKECDKEKKSESILIDLDLMIQIMMMYSSIGKNEITNDELSFIKNLVTNQDIIDYYNNFNNKKITWDFLKENVCFDEFKEFVDRVYKISLNRINEFVMLFAGEDSLTSTSYLNLFENSINNILQYYLSLTNSFDSNLVKYVVDEIFSKKYNECKNIFKRIDFII